MGNDIFSYTNRSLENSRAEGIKKLPIISKGDYTDYNATDPGMIILDYVHALVDMVNFYQDHQALETFISTAKERKNIFRLAKQLSFEINSAKGATVDLEFYVDQVYSETIKIPKYTNVATAVGTTESINFLTTEDAYILAGELSVTVPAVQGIFTTDSYQGTGISRFSNTYAAENQSYTLSRYNIDIDSIEVIDSLNRVWMPVDCIVFSMQDDRVYQKDLNYDGTITLKFGDGERGVLPESTDMLYINYIYNLAEEGRTGANTITKVLDKIYDLKGNKADVHVTNRDATSGGSGPMSDEDITSRAPGAIKAQGRAVTIKDFENLAKLVDGVADAKAYDYNNAPDLQLLYHEVKVVVIPEVGTKVNSSLLKNVYDFLYQRMIPPTNLQVLAPSEILVDIQVNVLRSNETTEGGLEYAIEKSITDYFNSRYGAIGEDFNPNELIAIINNVQGVRYVDSITPSKTVTVGKLSILRLRDMTINIL